MIENIYIYHASLFVFFVFFKSYLSFDTEIAGKTETQNQQ